MTDIGIDEQIAYAESWYADNKFNQAILATLRDHKRIEQAKVPEPVAWMTDDDRLAMARTQKGMPSAAKVSFNIPLYGPEVLDLLRRETAKNQKLTLELQSLLSQSMEQK